MLAAGRIHDREGGGKEYEGDRPDGGEAPAEGGVRSADTHFDNHVDDETSQNHGGPDEVCRTGRQIGQPVTDRPENSPQDQMRSRMFIPIGLRASILGRRYGMQGVGSLIAGNKHGGLLLIQSTLLDRACCVKRLVGL